MTEQEENYKVEEKVTELLRWNYRLQEMVAELLKKNEDLRQRLVMQDS